MPANDYQQKLETHFPNLVVNKRYSARQEISKIPRFISEYLIAKFSTSDGGFADDGFQRINDFLLNYRPEHKDREWIKHRIMSEGQVKLLDFFEATTDLRTGRHTINIPLLNIPNANISPEVIKENENLLKGGMWGLATIGYLKGTSDKMDIGIIQFVPFQFSRCSLSNFQDQRQHFTLSEWLDLLINTIGLDAAVYPSFQQKLILLSRLIPFVEDNTFLVELGPPGTGKTYLFDKISSYSQVVSGSVISPAALFFHGVTKKLGVLATSDVVLFDEIDKVGKKMDSEVVGKLLKFMESGSFDRGGVEIPSQCSIMFGGNLPIYKTPRFKLFPPEMQHKAFFDRIHGFIDGNALPTIGKSDEHLSKSFGLTSDYFSEIMHLLRSISYVGIVSEKVQLKNATLRDEKAVFKLTSGLLKLLYPDGNFGDEELIPLLSYAIYLRQQTITEIAFMDAAEQRRILESNLKSEV